jgi:hypothetical protein
VPAWGPRHEDLEEDDDALVVTATARNAVAPGNRDGERFDDSDTDEDVLSGCSDSDDNELMEEAETVALADMYRMDNESEWDSDYGVLEK